MNATQKAYAVALATFQTIEANVKADVESRGIYANATTEAEIEAADELEEDIQAELGYWTARDALRNAERVMVDAELDRIKRVYPSHAAELTQLRKDVLNHWRNWGRLVDIAFRAA